MSDTDSPSNDQRRQLRFPSVGIELLYSPLDRQILNDVSQSLRQATSHDISQAGMSFDVKQPLETGQFLLVIAKSPEDENETLKTEVRWCKHLADQHYRVGVSIVSIEKKSAMNTKGYVTEPIDHSIAVPTGASFICPACEQRSWFVLVGQQEGVPSPAVMPLYNCSECHTTRSIPSLLSYNRGKFTAG